MNSQKIRELSDRGLILFHEGELMLSMEAVSLLTGVTREELRSVPRDEQHAFLSKDMRRKMRRGASEARAATGSEDMLDVLYRKAVA